MYQIADLDSICSHRCGSTLSITCAPSQGFLAGKKGTLHQISTGHNWIISTCSINMPGVGYEVTLFR